MKKIIALILSIVMVSCFAGCGAKSDDNSKKTDTSATDWAYIQSKGEMVIGITYFEPMNYIDKETQKLTGFETEFAEAVCAELGVKATFQEINWNSKETELNSKNIDCIWNGMTIDEERQQTMAISVPYMSNDQVIVTKKENISKITSADSLDGKVVVAEKGSAGETVATSNAFFKKATYTAVDTMAKAVMEVAAGTADVCVIDFVTSIGMIGEGTDYSDLAVLDKDFAPEEYGVAFRKGSTETLEKFNAAVQTVANSGKLQKIAEKYKLADRLLIEAK